MLRKPDGRAPDDWKRSLLGAYGPLQPALTQMARGTRGDWNLMLRKPDGRAPDDWKPAEI